MLEDRLRFVGSALIALIGAVLSGVEFLNLFGYWGIAVVVVLAPLLFGLSYRYLPERMPSIADEITRSTQLKKVSDTLDAHYQGVIDRIDQKWDYQPSDGEQIFVKGNPRQRPKSLEQDKQHLKYFDSVWNLYSNGPVLYREYRQAEGQARNRILDDLMSAEPSLSPRLQESLPAMVFDRIDYVMRTGTLYAPLFEAKAGSVGGYPMVYLDGKMMDVVGEHTWTVDRARQLGSRMDKMVWNPQILHDVVQKRDALAKLNRNRSDFLSAKEEIVRKARSVGYYVPELTNGQCDDCKLLKDNLKSLRVGDGKKQSEPPQRCHQ